MDDFINHNTLLCKSPSDLKGGYHLSCAKIQLSSSCHKKWSGKDEILNHHVTKALISHQGPTVPKF